MMNQNPVDLLLVEDNQFDAELTIRELKNHNLANNLFHVKDGGEALDFIFGEGIYTSRQHINNLPKSICLRLTV
jgi:hypothetical protein